MKEKTVWVILRHCNEYDQYGGYFVSVHDQEPTKSPIEYFGRKSSEYEWFTKMEISKNTFYMDNHPLHHPALNDRPELKIHKEEK